MASLAELAQHPGVFAMGVGVANGVLAAVRDKPVSPKAAAITAAVIAAGELALVYDLPEEQRPDLLSFTAWSVLGTYVGLAGFVSWTEGQPSAIQKAGESMADWYSERQMMAELGT